MAEAEAARKYVKEILRPKMYSVLSKDQFIVEAMSTSYVTRRVMGNVSQYFKDVKYKRAALNPRNPLNKANAFERKMISYYNKTHSLKEWKGIVTINGARWFMVTEPIYMEKSCLRCHGDPKDAPAELIKKYGSRGGYFRKEGSVAGLDVIGVNIESQLATMYKTTLHIFAIGVAFIVLLFILVWFFFQRLVYNPLTNLINYCRRIKNGELQLTDTIDKYKHDELGELTKTFVHLIGHLGKVQNQLLEYSGKLEVMVEKRTRELNRHKVFLEAILSSAPIGFIVLTENGNIRFWNRKSEEIIGINYNDVKDKNINELNLPIPFKKLMNKNTLTDTQIEYEFIDKNQNRKYILVNSSVIIDNTYKSTDFIINFVDITEIKNLQEELNKYTQELEDLVEQKITQLRQSERRYKEIFNHANDAIIFLDAHTLQIIDSNPKWTELTGYSKEEILSSSLLNLLDPKDRKKAKRCLISPNPNPCAFDIINKKGGRTSVELISSSFFMDNHRYTMSILRDITTRRRLEKELLSMNAQLKKRNKELRNLTIKLSKVEEESRRKFADILHNQLGQDLAAIKINIGMLKKNIEQKNKGLADELDKVDNLLSTVIGITRDLTSEMYPIILDNLGFTAALNWYLDIFAEKFPIKTSLKVLEPIGRYPQEVETLLFRLVQEGLLNCAKHSKATHVAVHIEMREEKELVIKICDNGVGFPEDIQRNMSPKNGMGLHMIRERVTYLGGEFTISSKKSTGSTLTYKIPVDNLLQEKYLS
ncbi:hypothetical protein JCM13304A_03450 [Desulfothermus okinawensis JCM 13304]